jgi:glycerophosphoryl diester phosphodiesterase
MVKMSKQNWIMVCVLIANLFFVETGYSQNRLRVIKVRTAKDLHAFFRYQKNAAPIISGHRGGMVTGFPENSIPAFENTLKYTPAMFEVDPRLTKDSVVVLMHDATLDRTTTGKGKLSDYTWEEVKELRLKDHTGKVTQYSVPTLSEVIEWARGKTILDLDHKDVPLSMIADLIRKHKAEAFVMLTVHSPEEANYYLSRNPKSMFSAFIRNKTELAAYEEAGVPFSQLVAYIGPLVKPENKEMYTLLNAKGVMCMISSASSYDKKPTVEERRQSYRAIIEDGASILESDRPLEVAEAIVDMRVGQK